MTNSTMKLPEGAVFHRHGGVDWPVQIECPFCRLMDAEARIADLERELEDLCLTFEEVQQQLDDRPYRDETRIAELERELKDARAPYVMEQNHEWMRLFGRLWYSDKHHNERIAGLKRELDEARAAIKRKDAPAAGNRP